MSPTRATPDSNSSDPVRLLFVTQKIHAGDDDLAFVIQWIREFERQGARVEVICLEAGDVPDDLRVHSLGKEAGRSRAERILRFWRLIRTLSYDRVFVHMNPVYVTLGLPAWIPRRVPVYLWYTHYTMHVHVRVAGILCRRLFAATAQSLPQFDDSEKKVVTGHGVDVSYWSAENKSPDATRLLMVHRLCRSKRAEIGIEALTHLPEAYSLTIYGRDVDRAYVGELKRLVATLGLGERVNFAGPVPMPTLRDIYPRYRLLVNMAPETIDKTVLEAMCNGVYPVTTARNASAIGLQAAPDGNTPASVAAFIMDDSWRAFDGKDLRSIVDRNHSLESLVAQILEYVRPGC